MSEEGSNHEGGEESHSKRSRMKAFLDDSKDSWTKSVTASKDEYVKGKKYVQQQLGLGHKPNVIPPGEAHISGEHRPVLIGWHPVAGLAGKWFAEKSGLGKMITDNIHKYPDPTQHWAILVGNYSHELWMDEHLDVIYINGEAKQEEWHTFEVGNTRFNDEALRQAGEMVIFNMREKRPAYNLISNNCQNFAILMLDAIQVGAHKEFATSFEVYQKAVGPGAVADLFISDVPDDEKTEQKPVDGGEGKQNVVDFAQHVMDENTTKLDTHSTLH